MKTLYEICFEIITEYEDGEYDIDDSCHWGIKNKVELNQSLQYAKSMDEPFMFCVNKWTITDHDGSYESIYLKTIIGKLILQMKKNSKDS